MHAISDLLKRALLVGAMEVRLIPGRRTIVVLPQGENEVKGDPQSADKIQSLLAPIMTAAARQHLTSGFAEWDFELEGRGPVRVCAELKLGMVQASLFLDRCETLALQAERGRAPAPSRLPVPGPPSPPARREASIDAPIETDATDFASPALRTQPSLAREKLAYDNALSDGSTANIDRLLARLLELKGSDLHISTGSAPMMRVGAADADAHRAAAKPR